MEEKVQKLTNSDNIEGAVRGLVIQALAEFNKWHEPEAVAGLAKLEDSSIVVELRGPFCRTCGLYDYFDDLKLELEGKLGEPLETARVDSYGTECYAITYKIGGRAYGQ